MFTRRPSIIGGKAFLSISWTNRGLFTVFLSMLAIVGESRIIIFPINSWKERRGVAGDLKLVYGAATEQEAVSALDAFEKKWGKKYPHIGKSWRKNWSELSVYFKYSADLRRLIYTTNPIESFNRGIKKVTKNKAIFPNEDALLKMLYCAS
jgi:transposase-like protein